MGGAFLALARTGYWSFFFAISEEHIMDKGLGSGLLLVFEVDFRSRLEDAYYLIPHADTDIKEVDEGLWVLLVG